MMLIIFNNPALSANQENHYIIREDNFIKINLLDADGTSVALGGWVQKVTFDYAFHEKPVGKFFAESMNTLTKDLKEKGASEIKIFAEEAGEYNVTFIFKIEYPENTKPSRLITKNYNFTFVPKKVETKKILLAVNSVTPKTEANAYQEDGNVYLPITNTLFMLEVGDFAEVASRVIKTGKVSIQDKKSNEIDIQYCQELDKYYINSDNLGVLGNFTIGNKIYDAAGDLKVIEIVKYKEE